MRREKLNTLIAALVWLALWQVLSMALGNELLLPSPVSTLVTLGGLATTGVFYLNILWTVLRCLIAMAVSFIAGAAFAELSHRHYWIRKILTLPVGFFKAVPVMAIIIYVILVASADWVAIIVCFLMCFPIVYTNVLAGLDSTPAEYLELAKLYKLSPAQTTRHIYVPEVLPHVKSAISLIAGLSWKAVVAAEILSVPTYSLGYQMMNAKYYLETPALFAYILVIVLLSMAFEWLIKRWLSRLDRKGYEGSKFAPAKREKTDAVADEKTLPAGPEIVVSRLYKTYDEKAALEDENLVIFSGENLALMGPSGIGKTSLAHILAGLETQDSGTVNYQYPDPDDYNRNPVDLGEIAYLFQEDRLLPWLNVRDNIMLSRMGKNHRSEKRLLQLAKDLEIDQVLDKLPADLSGGMKHRVALARTFYADANIVILDEPFRGLNASLKKRILSRLWEKETEGRTVLLITHSDNDACTLCQRTAELI